MRKVKISKYVLNLEPQDYSPRAIEKWESSGYKYVESSWSNYTKCSFLDKTEVLIIRLERFVDSKVLGSFPNLKILVSATTGINHIDSKALTYLGVELVSLRGRSEFLRTITSTAEFTWAMILNLVRDIPNALVDVELGNWEREKFKGFEVFGKKIGIIGLGRIGSMVAQYAEVFGMSVLYVDPNVFDDRYFKVNSIEELVRDVDILSIHVNYETKNKNIIDEKIISLMKDGIFLVNTSRGEIWDEEAIVGAVKNGKIRGVGVDVLENESIGFKNSPIWKARNLKNIFLTPHIGGASIDAMWKCEEFTQELVLNR